MTGYRVAVPVDQPACHEPPALVVRNFGVIFSDFNIDRRDNRAIGNLKLHDPRDCISFAIECLYGETVSPSACGAEVNEVVEARIVATFWRARRPHATDFFLNNDRSIRMQHPEVESLDRIANRRRDRKFECLSTCSGVSGLNDVAGVRKCDGDSGPGLLRLNARRDRECLALVAEEVVVANAVERRKRLRRK